MLAVAGVLLGAPALCMPLSLPPDVHVAAERQETFASHRVPTGSWRDGTLPALQAEGALRQIAWRTSRPASTLALMTPLRDELAAAGFEILFECATEHCGGFDFRYAIELFPEPDMHVDLGDYRFLSARRASDAGHEFISLIVSRSSGRGYAQLTHVAPSGEPAEVTSGLSTKARDPDAADYEYGAVVALDDLRFETGRTRLSAGSAGSLAELAAFLRANPGARAILVGHSDAQGSLAGNITLSRQRADAVRDVLVAEHGVAAGQISTQGVGHLAPRASNLTPGGRQQNRRVEALIEAAP
ncbi:OmpA family protein [Plastorhodobacter daqingensis]|uniref:OmpA family protein n=1 Tax=Plastorhodobacter daqingensis TaxID=1387281 RepID=A0ABW2UQK5_9RHOB